MTILTPQDLKTFLFTRAVTDAMIKPYEFEINAIAHLCRTHAPKVIHAGPKWALDYAPEGYGRSIVFKFEKLATARPVQVFKGTDRIGEGPEAIKAAFQWLFEDRIQHNRARHMIADMEAKTRPPYRLVSYFVRPQNVTEEEIARNPPPILEPPRKISEASLKKVYDRFRRHVHERSFLQIQMGPDENGRLADVANIDTQVLEKAFYTGG